MFLKVFVNYVDDEETVEDDDNYVYMYFFLLCSICNCLVIIFVYVSGINGL